MTLIFSDWLEEQLADPQLKISKSERTKARIKIAAAVLLNDILYQDLHISQICSTADVGAGTFYRYFKGKKELTEEILAGVIMRFSDLMPISGKESKHNSMFELFTQANIRFFRLTEANQGLFRCLLQANSHEFYLGEIFENSTSSWALRVTKSILNNHIELSEGSAEFTKLNEACTLTTIHCLASMLNDLAARMTFRNDTTLKTLFNENGIDDQKTAGFLAVLWHRVIFGCDPEGHTVTDFFTETELRERL